MLQIFSTETNKREGHPSRNLTVVGAQWGDEGKGRVIDWLVSRSGPESAAHARFDVVIRFNGGNNAGHTVVVNGKRVKLSLIPSGVVAGGVLSIIASGVAIDPFALLEEIEELNRHGIEVTPENLRIADNAVLVLPVHQALDRAREARSGAFLGTTGRGIGPAYEDKAGRRAIRVCDLADEATLSIRLDTLLDHNNALLKHLGAPIFEKGSMLAQLREVRARILPFADRVWRRLWQAQAAGRCLLFEGAQAILLDIDHGTYPFVTSSNCAASGAAAAGGLSPQAAGSVLGVAKAYATRVGSGPFPTELDDETGRLLGERGSEFGTNTGRPRRCGWLDAVALRQSVRIGGIQQLALTKLDVLDGLPELKICTSYRIGSDEYDHLPSGARQQADARPVYETLPGWPTPVAHARAWEDLPEEAIRYIRRVEQLTETPIVLISTGADRDAMITAPRAPR
jgi:adenylosuccinate synthase